MSGDETSHTTDTENIPLSVAQQHGEDDMPTAPVDHPNTPLNAALTLTHRGRGERVER